MKIVSASFSFALIAGFFSIAHAEGGTGDTAFSTLNGSYEIQQPNDTEPMCKMDGQQCESFAECCSNMCMVGICGNGGHSAIADLQNITSRLKVIPNMMISKKAVFVFENLTTAHLAASQINGRYSHVAKLEGKFLTLTAGLFELLESKRVALSLGGIESESEESKNERERDRDSRWNSPKTR